MSKETKPSIENNTKKVWKYFQVGGEYVGEFPIDVVLTVPLTAVPPLEGEGVNGEPLTIENQIFNTQKDEWQEIRNTTDSEALETLKTLFMEQSAQNVRLQSELTHTQDALAELFNIVAGGTK